MASVRQTIDTIIMQSNAIGNGGMRCAFLPYGPGASKPGLIGKILVDRRVKFPLP
jgi:hypothetical protein